MPRHKHTSRFATCIYGDDSGDWPINDWWYDSRLSDHVGGGTPWWRGDCPVVFELEKVIRNDQTDIDFKRYVIAVESGFATFPVTLEFAAKWVDQGKPEFPTMGRERHQWTGMDTWWGYICDYVGVRG